MNKNFLGVGWKFPIKINSKGGLSYSKYEQDIKEALYIIIGTAKKDRLMLPDFGCGIHEQVFAPINPTTIGDIENNIFSALSKWEPRIEVLEVNIEQDITEDNKLMIKVNYRVLSTNSYNNIVYPFYLTERGGK